MDTGLFSVQPIERDPTEYKAQCITYRHRAEGHVSLCHNSSLNSGFEPNFVLTTIERHRVGKGQSSNRGNLQHNNMLHE